MKLRVVSRSSLDATLRLEVLDVFDIPVVIVIRIDSRVLDRKAELVDLKAEL